MTREEAIKILDPETSREYLTEKMGGFWNQPFALALIERAQEMALSALRAQQTPLDRSRWEGCKTCSTKHCWACKNSLCGENELPCSTCDMGSNFDPIGFCPDCGKPLTEQAWAELERRMCGGTTD